MGLSLQSPPGSWLTNPTRTKPSRPLVEIKAVESQLSSRVKGFVRDGWANYVGSIYLHPYWEVRNELSLDGECIYISRGIAVVVAHQLETIPGATVKLSWPSEDETQDQKSCMVATHDHKSQKMVKCSHACEQVKYAPPVPPVHPWIWPAHPWNMYLQQLPYTSGSGKQNHGRHTSSSSHTPLDMASISMEHTPAVAPMHPWFWPSHPWNMYLQYSSCVPLDLANTAMEHAPPVYSSCVPLDLANTAMEHAPPVYSSCVPQDLANTAMEHAPPVCSSCVPLDLANTAMEHAPPVYSSCVPLDLANTAMEHAPPVYSSCVPQDLVITAQWNKHLQKLL